MDELDDIPTFAARLKTKFPEYQDVDDVELVERTVRKHPTYASQVKLPDGFKLLQSTSGYKEIDDLYEQAGRNNNVDPNLLLEQGRKETAFDADVFYGRRGSSKGAKGSGQFMPGTAKRFNVDVNDPRSGIDGQARYMRELLDQFDDDENLALAGYNAGEGNVIKHGKKVPPFRETQDYVKTIGGSLGKIRGQGLTLKNFYQPDVVGGPPPATDTDVTSPVPESPDTLQRHVISTLDTGSPKKITWLPKGNAANNYILSMAEARRLTRVDMPDGIALVNIDKLGITKDQAKEYVIKNGRTKDAGFVIDMGNNTGDGQPAVVAIDPNTGKEVFAAVTPTPESAQLQAQQNAAMFPGTVQVPTNTDEVASARLSDPSLAAADERPQLADDQPSMPDAPVAQATDADFNTANEYLKSVGQPLLTREQFDVAQKTVGKSAQATGYATQAPQQRQSTQKGQPTSPVIAQGKTAKPPTGTQSQKYTDAAYELPLSNKNGSYKSNYYDEVASRLSSELNVPYEVARSVVEQNPIKFTDGSEADDTYFAEVAKTGKSINAQIGGSVKRQIVDAAKQVADKQNVYRKKLDEYAKTEAPSVADLMARKDAGLGVTDDEIKAERDAYQKALEEKGLTGTVQDPYAAGIASGELSPETRRAIRIDINAANADLEKKRQKFAQDILKDSGSFVKYQKDKERIKDEYVNRPLAEPLEFAKNLAGAVPKALASVLKTGDLALNMNPLKLVYDQATGRGFKIDETSLSDIGNNINQYIEKNRNPDLQDKWYINMLPDTIGQLATQITAGVLTGGATLPTLIGASMGAAAQYDEAKKFNADDKQKMTAAVVGALAAIPDALLFSKWFKGADEVAQTGFIKQLTQSLMSKLGVKYGEEVAAEVTKASIKQFAGNILKNAGFEGVQEVSENKINDWLALNTFDPSAKRREKLLSISDDDVSSFVGGLIGGAGGGGVQAYTENLSAKAQEDLFEQSRLEVDRLLEKGEITPAKAAEIKAVVAKAAEDANKGAGKPIVETVRSSETVKPKSDKPKVTLEPVEDIAKSDTVSPTPKTETQAKEPLTSETQKIFHGTTAETVKAIEKGGFDVSKTADGTIWFTNDKSAIEKGEVAATGQGGIIERQLDESKLKLGGWAETDKYSTDELISQGYDGLKLPGENGEITYQIFNPEKLGKVIKPQPTKPIDISPVRERAKAKAAEKFGVKGEAVDPFTEVREQTQQTDNFIAQNDGKSFQVKTPNGSLILHPSTRVDGKWQLTRLDGKGDPIGDTVFDTYKQAVEETRQYGAKLSDVKISEEKKVNPVKTVPQTQGASLRFNVGAADTFEIAHESGAKVTGYLKNQDFPNQPATPTRGELFYAEVPEGKQRSGIGTSLAVDALQLMRVNGVETVNMHGTTAAGRALIAKLQRDNLLSEPIQTSPTGKAEYKILDLAQPKAEAVKEPHEMTLAEAQIAKADSELPKNIVLSDFGGNYIIKEKNGAYKVWKYTDGGSTSLAGTIGFKGDVGLERAKQRLARLSADSHKLAVSRAVRDGKTVPQEVLNDYPDLAKLAARRT